jgi:hypothetical protein
MSVFHLIADGGAANGMDNVAGRQVQYIVVRKGS